MSRQSSRFQAVNSGRGPRCAIDGQCFDAGGICNRGHGQGEIYSIPITVVEKTDVPEKVEVVCEPFANRCSLCGAFFDEDGDVCGGPARHIIGQKYSVRG